MGLKNRPNQDDASRKSSLSYTLRSDRNLASAGMKPLNTLQAESSKKSRFLLHLVNWRTRCSIKQALKQRPALKMSPTATFGMWVNAPGKSLKIHNEKSVESSVLRLKCNLHKAVEDLLLKHAHGPQLALNMM